MKKFIIMVLMLSITNLFFASDDDLNQEIVPLNLHTSRNTSDNRNVTLPVKSNFLNDQNDLLGNSATCLKTFCDYLARCCGFCDKSNEKNQ